MRKIALSIILGMALYASGGNPNIHQAVVLQKGINSGGYTYVKVKEGSDVYWITMTQRDFKVGQTVKYRGSGLMPSFHSKTLNRTFHNIMFADDVPSQAKTDHVVQKRETKSADKMNSKFQKDGSVSIAKLFKDRDAYANKTVVVRGKVTKVSERIMGLNWVHIKDGSSFSGTDELVFTTDKEAPQVGEVVFAKGKVIKDKDFGYGYFYPLIVQNAVFYK